MATYTKADLILVRSNTGDGGWSLHTKDQIKDAEEHDDVPELVGSGPAEAVGDGWSRPNADDYAAALSNANRE